MHILICSRPQIQEPAGGYRIHDKSVSSGEHSFDATQDGRYTYCFSNEHWSANSKEVSFNVHGIVYVDGDAASSDPLDIEGEFRIILAHICREVILIVD